MPPIADLPPLVQYIIYGLAGIGTLAYMLRGYLKSPDKNVSPAPKDLMLTAVSLADMSIVRELVAVVKLQAEQQTRCADALEDMCKIVKSEAYEARIKREVEERVALEVSRQKL